MPDSTALDPADANAADAPAPTRSGRSPKDMAISLVVLLIPVLLIVGAYRYLYGGDTTVTVDPTEVIAAAGRDGLSPLPPATAPEGWQTTVAQFGEGTLRIGYLDAEGDGARLAQSRKDVEKLVKAELTDQAGPAGETVVDGVTWQLWRGPHGEDAMTRRSGNSTVLLLGQLADLAQLARNLNQRS